MSELEYDVPSKAKPKRFIVELDQGFIKVDFENDKMHTMELVDLPQDHLSGLVQIMSEHIMAVLAERGEDKDAANIKNEILSIANAEADKRKASVDE